MNTKIICEKQNICLYTTQNKLLLEINYDLLIKRLVLPELKEKTLEEIFEFYTKGVPLEEEINGFLDKNKNEGFDSKIIKLEEIEFESILKTYKNLSLKVRQELEENEKNDMLASKIDILNCILSNRIINILKDNEAESLEIPNSSLFSFFIKKLLVEISLNLPKVRVTI